MPATEMNRSPKWNITQESQGNFFLFGISSVRASLYLATYGTLRVWALKLSTRRGDSRRIAVQPPLARVSDEFQ
jgi:hypothetical protein